MVKLPIFFIFCMIRVVVLESKRSNKVKDISVNPDLNRKTNYHHSFYDSILLRFVLFQTQCPNDCNCPINGAVQVQIFNVEFFRKLLEDFAFLWMFFTIGAHLFTNREVAIGASIICRDLMTTLWWVKTIQ